MSNPQPMSLRKIILYIGLFLLILASFRIGWIFYHQYPHSHPVEKGKVDFSNWTFTDQQSLSLNGEWEFYPNEWLSPQQATAHSSSPFYLQVPGDWREAFGEDPSTSYGYGTYRLVIQLPEDTASLYGIRFKEIMSAARVFINGNMITERNTPTMSKEHPSIERGPLSTFFYTDASEVEVLIHVSNFDFPFYGGMTNMISFGTDNVIAKESSSSTTLQLVVSMLYLLHSLYAFFIYFYGKGKYEKELFYYGLMLIFGAISILIDDDIVVHLPIYAEHAFRLLLFLFISILWALMKFLQHLFKLSKQHYRWVSAIYLALSGCLFFFPFELYDLLVGIVVVFYIVALTYLFIQTTQTILKGYPDAIFILLFITSYTSNLFWGYFIKLNLVRFPYYPFDFIMSIVVIAILLFKRHIRVVDLNTQQTIALQQADQLKNQFLANTSHELRNPLHGIINIAQSVLDDREQMLTEKNREHLKLLMRIGHRTSLLLNDLLDITRLQERNLPIEKKPTNLQAVVSGVFDMIRFMSEGKPIALQNKIPSHISPVLADENRLIQILFNLVHNAIKFTEKGSVTVTAEETNGIVTIHVIDTGIGMKQETINRIFLPYEQGDETQVSSGGIGLGLPISKQLIELQGSTLVVNSTPGQGSTFTFTLPIAQTNDVSTKLEQPQIVNEEVYLETCQQNGSHSEKKSRQPCARVLVVDDDMVNVKVLEAMLEDEYEVVTALNGKEALQQLTTGGWDLVISDVMMPYMSGYELTKHIRKQFTLSELPILLLTARNQLEDIYTGFHAGANDYVAKPVDALELKSRVQALTNLKQSVHDQLRMEAAWLQAQIQPHFLFNTLNTIASLAEIDTNRMVKLLEEFGNYLRKSFAVHNTMSLIPLKEELDLTRSYVYIEKERFGERLQVEWQIEAEPHTLIPPLSIQPLVENAVRHGVLKRIKGGIVTISIVAIEDYYQVSIADNGVGIEPDRLTSLLLADNSEQVYGIGIRNTHHRLKKRFGKGLEITSKPGEGTTVTFQLPIVQEDS